MLRYPTTDRTCQYCKTRTAMFNDVLCGACSEELENKPKPKSACRSCGAPHNVMIRRALVDGIIWVKDGENDEPGFGERRRNIIDHNGHCRYCNEHGHRG